MKIIRHFYQWGRQAGLSSMIGLLIVSFLMPAQFLVGRALDDGPEGATDSSSESSLSKSSNPAPIDGDPAAALQAAIEAGTGHPLDTFRLTEQFLFTPRSERSKNGGHKIRIVGADGREVAEILDRGPNAKAFHIAPPGSRVELWKGTAKIYQFSSPVRQVGFYDGYLVYLGAESYARESSTHLVQMMDLNQFRHVAGFSQPHVYDLPVHSGGEGDLLSGETGSLRLGNVKLEEPLLAAPKSVRGIRSNLTVRVLSEAGTEVGVVYLRGSEEQTLLATPPGATFEIWFQDQRLYQFKMPVRQVGFYKGYLVFLDQDSYINESSFHNLQFVHLKQFRHLVGRSELPVFRVPIQSNDENELLSVDKGILKMGPAAFNESLLEVYSQLQRLGLDLAANLSNPAVHDDASHVVADFSLILDQMFRIIEEDAGDQVDTMRHLRKNYRDVATQLESEVAAYRPRGEVLKIIAKIDKEAKTAGAKIEDESIAELGMSFVDLTSESTAFNNMVHAHAHQKKLLARLGLLWSRLSMPRPNAVGSIREGLAMIASGLSGGIRDGHLTEGALQLIHNRYARFGVPMVGAALFGAMYPEIAELYVSQGLGVVQNVLECVLGKANDTWTLAKEAASQTAAGFNPYVVYQAYLSPETVGKLAVGMTAAATTLFISLGTPHFVINSYRLYQDLTDEMGLREALLGLGRKVDGAVTPAEGNLVSRLWKYITQFRPSRFIQRQNNFQAEYLAKLSRAAANTGDAEEGPKFTAEQDAEVEAIVQDIRSRKTSWIGGALRKITRWPWHKRFEGEQRERRLTSWYGALMHFCASSASFTASGRAYVDIWNKWFSFRSFVWHPRVWAMAIYYPNYFKTLADRKSGLATPSELNGGLRPFWKEYPLRLANLVGFDHLEILRAWEKKVLPVEAAIEREVLRKSSIAMIRLTSDAGQLQRFVETSGVDRVGDHTLQEYSWAQRRFFREYTMRLQDRAMRVFLDSLIADHENADSGAATGNVSELSAAELKALTLREITSLALDPKDAREIVAKALAESDLFEEVSSAVMETGDPIRRVRDALNYGNIMFLDPKHNRQMGRVQSVNRQANNAQALARAVRSAMAAFVVDKPMELALMFVCLAGVTEGLMKPLHDEMFGPNSTFFLGTFPFYTGFMSAAVMGAFADIWMKLQVDEQNEGSFGERPTGKYAKSGYFRWFGHQFLRRDKNTWYQNQAHYTKLIIANVPAALVTYLLTNVLTLGRLDLDAYLLGYLMYLTPVTGLNTKTEQVFEMASGYFAKDYPEELVPHPAAQEQISKDIGIARMKFNIFYKLYENILWNFIGLFEAIKAGTMGPRSLGRILFGGYTPTEWVFYGTEWTKDTLGFIPGLSAAVDRCREILLHNYTDSIVEGFPKYGGDE